MKIKNIEDLKRNINSSTFWTFCLIFCFSVAGLLIIHNKFLEKQAIVRSQQITSTIRVFESSLSERLSIIASSTAFLDYLRSGDKTREQLYPEFLSQISTLREPSIVGMKIIDKYNRNTFKYGQESSSYVKLHLCYLNQSLTSEFGICEFSWVLYFSKQYLLDEFKKINKSIKICNHCREVNLAVNGIFGSFPIKDFSDMKLAIELPEENDQFFRIYLLIILSSVVLSGVWAWFRLSNILNNYIANPIKNLADCLRTNEVIEKKDNIDEIQYLIDEVNKWKQRVKHASEVEHAARIGKIAAQLAHDIRSPLMSVDMVVSKMDKIPDNDRKILRMALSRISDIANNFLEQYRFKGKLQQINSNEECLATLLKSIVDEKKMQYTAADIGLKIDLNNKKAVSKINSADFKRVISNLIDNAVEAANREGIVAIKLSQFGNFNIISIADSGCGVSPDILPHIFDGVSRGKKNGNGLGLPHAKAKIEEWGGEIRIQSEMNSGTIITLTLPLCV